ncbi:MAG: hypothetical protein H6838_17480 [Planctomycetes bacterium]|nr:hypothetical protein [Planctomycetota bacterium]
MDVGAFVQENKRWLIGCAIGALVWLIASAIVGSLYDVQAATAEQAGLVRSSKSAEVYTRDALAAANEEAEKLAAERQRLQESLGFVPSAKYQLAGHGDANQYLFQVGRELKERVLNDANERNVEISDKDVSWPVPTGVDEIRGVLFGLELLDEVATRLFAAHDAVREQQPEAMALRGIRSLKLEERRGQRSVSGRRRGEVDLRDLVTQERINFTFEGDEATFALFLEACQKPGRTLAIESWTLTPPAKRGDPCQLKGSLLGIAFKPAAEGGQ